ncbi:conserved hypothetical protein [uncultured Desulfobacterium sp.]|uniref:Uncharacterized protein n=1 Tax=uncultured Desulfobacterium sp. TaxID=201089 RepID=A0A445N111_9BACT|nr:conserved hypothetical protein [uncultured Desulfobacterium sp.]
MKKAIIFIFVAGLILGTSMVGFAEMKDMKHGEGEGMMMGEHMNWPMRSGMHTGGMMGMRMIATEDGGIVVMSSCKLYKYDKDLNLKKEVEIPIDFEHIKKIRMKMKETGMMGTTEEKSEKPKP